MKYTTKDYLDVYPFVGDEGERTLQTSRIVKTRKDHMCLLSGNIIKAGSYARHDKALVDRDFWGSYYISLEVLDKMIDENELLPLPNVKLYMEFREYAGF